MTMALVTTRAPIKSTEIAATRSGMERCRRNAGMSDDAADFRSAVAAIPELPATVI